MMADQEICGHLYYYRKKGLSKPYYLTCGKTTIGSSLSYDIRIKGVDNLFCVLDSNEEGFTVLVNPNEDDRVLLNDVCAQKYSVLSHNDHFQLADKKFKYCKPYINEEDLKAVREAVATKIFEDEFQRQSKRKSTFVSPLKRLQSPTPRRFSTGSISSEIKCTSAVPKRNRSMAKSSTPRSSSKSRLPHRISRPRHSALGVLKENEIYEFEIKSGKMDTSSNGAKKDNASKTDFKTPTPKKSISNAGNLKEVDLNTTVSSCCSPIPTKAKMYSGNLSDVSDFTTPENNVSAANITPLNVSKRKTNIRNSSFSYVEASTPKSAVKRRGSSAIYRPIVEEITPVSPVPRSSLRISSLKKPAFTERRSVNFNISSNSESSLINSDLVENVSFKVGTKRKRNLSDISTRGDKKKFAEKAQRESVNRLVFSLDDSDSDFKALKDCTLESSLEAKENTLRKEKTSTVSTAVEIDSDPEDICVSFTRKDKSGRQYIVNSGPPSPSLSLSRSDYTGRRTSIHKHRRSKSHSMETWNNYFVNSAVLKMDSFSEGEDDEIPDEADAPPLLDTTNPVGRVSIRSCNSLTLPSSAVKKPKKSIDRTNVPMSDEDGRIDTALLNISTNKEPHSPNGASEDSMCLNLSASDVSTQSGRISRDINKVSFVEDSPDSTTRIKASGRTSTPLTSDRSRASRSVSRASSGVLSKSSRSTVRSNSLNLLRNTRSSVTKSTSKTLLMKQLKRRFSLSVTESGQSHVMFLRSSVASEPPSEASISTRATSRKSSSSENTSTELPQDCRSTSRRSMRNSKIDYSGTLKKSLASNHSPSTQRRASMLDGSNKRTSSESYKLSASDDSLSGDQQENADHSLIKTSVGEMDFAESLNSSGLGFNNVSPAVTDLSRTSNSITFSFVNSSFDGSLQESEGIRRSRRLSRPTIDESVYEISKLTSRKSSNDMSNASNRIREWIQSPAVSKSPLLEGDDISSRASNDKDPTDIKITEATFSEFLESPKKTPKAKRSVSASLASENDPSDITRLRRLLKTPNSATSSKNNATNIHSAKRSRISAIDKSTSTDPNISTTNCVDTKVAESDSFEKVIEKSSQSKVRNSPRNDYTRISGVRRHIASPKKQSSQKNDLTNISGSKKLLETSREQKTPKNDLTKVTGIKKLMATPREPKSPKNDLTHVAGLKQLLKTPKLQNSPKNDLTRVAGVKKLMATPKEQKSPDNDLTNIAGVKKLMATPKELKSPDNDLTNIAGVKKLMATPKEQKSPNNDLTNVAGVKKLMATPKEQKSPNNDLTNVAGVKKLMATPKEQKSPNNDLTNVAGVKRFLRTPKEQKSPMNDLTHVAGVKKLLASPKEQNSPKNDLTNVAAVKWLLRTPKEQKSPKNDLTNVAGIKKLLASPKEQQSPNNDLTNVAGVKLLLKTPRVAKSPRNYLRQVAGLKKLMATPNVLNSPVNDLSDVSGVKEMLRTPRERRSVKNDLTNISGVKRLLKTPGKQFSPKNDLTNIVGLKKLLGTPKRQRSPENDLSDVRGVKKLLKTPKVQSPNISNDDFEMSGIDRLFNESMDNTFDRLLDKKQIRTYSRSPKKDGLSDKNNISPLQDISSRNKRKGKKQLYDSVRESVSTSEAAAKENPILSKPQSSTPAKNEAFELAILPESLRSKRGRRNRFVPKVVLAMDDNVKVTSTPVSNPNENENKIESNEGTKKANKKRKNENSDDNSKKSKISREVDENDSNVELTETKATKSPIINTSTSNDNKTGSKRRPRRVKDTLNYSEQTSEQMKNVELETSNKRTLRRKKIITDVEESNTHKVTKNIEISEGDVAETHSVSLDSNLKPETKTRKVKDTDFDNDKVAVTNDINTKTRRRKKELENNASSCHDSSENSSTTKTQTKRGRGKKNIEESSYTGVSDSTLEIKTRKGRKNTEKKIEPEQKSTSTEYKDSMQNEIESSMNDVVTKKTRTTRSSRKNTKESTNNTQNEKTDPKTENSNENTSKEKLKSEKKVSVVTARNTRANRGQNKKYDDIEWHTPVKSPSKQSRKNVTFDKNVKLSTPIVIHESPVRTTRSRRAKK